MMDPLQDDSSYGYPEADIVEEMIYTREMLDRVGSCTDYDEYVNTEWWRQLSDEILKRDLETCQECGAVATVVHHLEYPKLLGNEDPDDLISLCRACHAEKHRGSFRGYWK